MTTHTTHITAELSIDGETDREVELVVTTDRHISEAQALKILRVLHPNHVPAITRLS